MYTLIYHVNYCYLPWKSIPRCNILRFNERVDNKVKSKHSVTLNWSMYLQIIQNELQHFMKLLEDMWIGFYFFNYVTPHNKEWAFPSPFCNSTQCLTFKIKQIKKVYTITGKKSNYFIYFLYIKPSIWGFTNKLNSCCNLWNVWHWAKINETGIFLSHYRQEYFQ